MRSFTLTLTVTLALALLGCEESRPAPADARPRDTQLARDAKLANDLLADQRGSDAVTDRKAGDAPAQGEAGATFACGALHACATASQYCERFSGGACGGPVPSDAGLCPPDCNLTSCPGGQQACVCSTFTCKPLPAGCTSCACIGAAPQCSCSQQNPGGPIQVHCMAP